MTTALDRLRDRVHAEVADGHTPSCQAALHIDGALVLDETVQSADRAAAASDAPLRFAGFSIAKGFVAVLVARLAADGILDLDRPVAATVASFATNGKGGVTLRHLLTHTAGLPNAPMRPIEGADRERRRARFATWRLDHEPGSAMRYHATSAGWVLAEVIEEATGEPVASMLEDLVLTPLGLAATSLGAPAGVAVQELVAVGDELPPETAAALAAQGIDVRGPSDASLDFVLAYNDPAIRAAAVPGAGIVTTAADVVGLYAALLDDRVPGLPTSWRNALVDEVVIDHLDPTLGIPANRTLGFVVAGDDGHAALRGFGTATSPRAFGQPGVGGQTAWADPDTGIAFCLLTSAMARNPVTTWIRVNELCTLAAACA